MFLLSIRTRRNPQEEPGTGPAASSGPAAQGGSTKVNESYPKGACQKHYRQARWIDSEILSIND